MRYFLDTNIFLRRLVYGSKKDSIECGKIFKKAEKGEILVATAGIVLAEIAWVLGSVYKESRARIGEILGSIISMRGLEIVDTYDYTLAVKLYMKSNIKYIDAVIASTRQIVDKDWILVSYDEDFRKLPVKWQLPGSVS